MPGMSRVGSLVVSFDTPTRLHELAANAGPAVSESFVASLVKRLAKNKLTATWSAADPATSPYIAQVNRAQGQHAFAVVADSSWCGGPNARDLCARDLGRMLNIARAAGLSVDALVVPSDLAAGCWDVVSRHGIRAVRRGEAECAVPQGLLGAAIEWSRARWSKPVELRRPRPLTSGLWNVPPTMLLDTVSGRLRLAGSVMRVCRGIDRAADARAIFHLVVDLSHLAAHPSIGLRAVEQIARHAAGLRHDGVLESLSLGEAVERFTRPSRAKRGQSILRPLAA